MHAGAHRVRADRRALALDGRRPQAAGMNTEDAATILGVDSDTIEDLEDILGLDGRWTISDLERAAEVLDEGDGDDEDDDEECEDDEDDPAED